MNRTLARQIVLIATVAGAIAVVSGNREFPSQDGPLHVYYAEVTRNLLFNTGRYDGAFAITHYVTPYILQTCLLMAFDFAFDPLVSEKLLVCCYLILFAFGFRYLVRSALPDDEIGALFAVPLLFNYFVFAGTYNYVLGLSIALWAAGYWVRYSQAPTFNRRVQWAGFVVILTITHPLALLSLLLFAGVHTAMSIVSGAVGLSVRGSVAKYRSELICLGISSLSLLWVVRFMTGENRIKVSAGSLRLRVIESLFMWAISPLKTRPYRYFLVGVVASAAIAVVWGLWKGRDERRFPAAVFFVPAILCYGLTLFSPPTVSGGTNLGNRLFIFGILLLLASAAVTPMPYRLRRAAAAVVCLASLLCFVKLYRVGARVNSELAPLLDAPVAAAHSRVAWVTGNNADREFTHEPRYWAAAHYARRSNAVLANYGFLYLSYMNLRPGQPGKCQSLDPVALTDRPSMGKCLLDVAAEPDRPRIDMVVSASTDASALASAYGLQRTPYGNGSINFYGRP